MRRAAAWLATLAGFTAAAAGAAPDLAAPREIGPFRVYPDSADERRFYLAPGDLEVATDENGRPELHFLQLRYTGTALYGNQGEAGSHSTLTLGVRLDAPSPAEMAFLRRSLASLANLGRVELRPLPVVAFEAVLAYVPIGDVPAEVNVVGEGHFESEDAREARSDDRAFWSERTFTISMDAETSQLFWDLLHRQQLAVSINYAFFSRGVHTNELATVDVDATEREVERELLETLRDAGVPLAIEKPRGIAARLLERLRAERSGEEVADEDDAPGLPERTRLVQSGATAVRVDAERWPELFQRVDFNDRMPPGYAVVKVYCYDFAETRRPDLFYKKVEIEAEAVGGRRVSLDAKFLYSQPDLYARTLRFPVAVQVDRPFRYRVTTAARDGRTETGPWIERAAWGGILDITTPADASGSQREVEG